MNVCRTFLPGTILCLTGIALLAAQPAFATTYTTYVTSAANSGNVDNYGLTDSSQVVLLTFNGFGPAYTVFTPPSTYTGPTGTPPALPYDNGTVCTPGNMGSLIVAGQGRCNGSLSVFGASSDGGLDTGLYLFNSSNSLLSLLYPAAHQGFDNFLLNSRGDVAVVVAGGAAADSNLLLVASTPEPSSLMLMGTGLLSAVAVARRRFRV